MLEAWEGTKKKGEQIFKEEKKGNDRCVSHCIMVENEQLGRNMNGDVSAS